MIYLVLGVILLMLLGVPVALSLAGGSLVFLLITDQVPLLAVAQRMMGNIDSFALLAIPFFILAGNLMNTGGITKRIFAFAGSIFGWMPGGLGYVNIGASIIFSGMSGAAVADAGGLGSIEIQAMREAGYDDEFAIGVTAASSTIGPIIPPSLPMIIMGVVGGISIGDLFIGGIVPGLIMGLALSIMVFFYAMKRKYGTINKFRLSNVWFTFRHAFLPLMTVVLIIGGILGGIFTPTEAAVAASIYSLFLGFFVYKTLTWKDLRKVVFQTAEMTASILLIVSAAGIFGWILTTNRMAEVFASGLLSLTDNRIILLLLINLVLLLVGCFLDSIAAITIMTPVLMPIAMQLGLEPVQFGIMVVLNLMIGLLTPPLGMVLYVLSTVSKVSFEKCVKGTAPFLIPLIATLLLITFVPQISMVFLN
jgi:tripartite ATP-independent transporter DctM subunit